MRARNIKRRSRLYVRSIPVKMAKPHEIAEYLMVIFAFLLVLSFILFGGVLGLGTFSSNL